MTAINSSKLVRASCGSNGAAITLTHYAAGERQARHEHDHTQISFLLAGSIAETIGSRCHDVRTSGHCVKLAGVGHQNVWGRTGALMLTARLKASEFDGLERLPLAVWRQAASPDRRLVQAFMTCNAANEVDGIIADLIGSMGATAPPDRAPPPWLTQVIEALWDGEVITAEGAARLARVHRVHLSRAFGQHVGVPFSVYRRHVMTSRAIEATLRTSERFAGIAHECGFADQSHMNRAMAGACGTSPRRLRQSPTATN